MGAGIFNVVIGGLALAAGLSGQFTLPFFESPTALAVLGGLVCAYGVYQIIRSRRSSG